MATPITLELAQSLITNGARAAAIILLQACYWVAIPQLAKDIAGAQPSMHGGNSDVSLILYRTNENTNQLEEFQQLDVPGGEDAEFFVIDDRVFLATASVRSGSDPNYNYDVESCIFEWNGSMMDKFQCMLTSGAKQWHSFKIAGRHFLALAQGLESIPGVDVLKRNSTIYEWDGNAFRPFQILSSQIGYNWLYFSFDGREFLAYADNIEPSRIMEWNGEKFVNFQAFDGVGGRAFSFFEKNNRKYLAFARVRSDSIVYEWDGNHFQDFQILPGQGGREVSAFDDGTSLYLVQVNFITGDLENPNTAMNSTIYHMDEDGLQIITQFPTFGGTDVKTFKVKDQNYMVVTESLAQSVRFRQDSHVYRLISEGASTNETNETNETASGQEHEPLVKRQANQNSEFLALFSAYTGGPDSLGYQYRTAFVETQSSDPMIVCTATYMLFYPGNEQDPSYFPFRLETRGFIELTAISHIGPAMATLAQMSVLGKEWKSHAQNLLNTTRAVKGVNSESLWRDFVQAEAYRGREANISAMVNYACDMTIHFIEIVLADPVILTPRFVQEDFLGTTESASNATVSSYATGLATSSTTKTWNGTISFNEIMIATFFLNGLDTAYRMQKWLKQYNIDWTKAQVLINGQAGRPTAAVTISTNSIAGVILQSFPDLPIERLYIAPHGPVPDIINTTANSLRQYESEFRMLWGSMLGYTKLGAEMFAGFPAYKPAVNVLPIINSSTTTLSELPLVTAPYDWFSLITRLRVTLGDVRQTLSACVTDYAAQQLFQNNFEISKITVSGLDGYDYASSWAPLAS